MSSAIKRFSNKPGKKNNKAKIDDELLDTVARALLDAMTQDDVIGH